MPARGSGQPPHLRVLAKTIENGECWEFQGGRTREGYGRIFVGGVVVGKRSSAPAHRVVYEAMVGPVAEGLELDHLCRNRRCVNPEHLEAISHLENVRRGYWGKNHCKYGHVYDEKNTRVYRRVRFCRTCERIRSHNRRQ